MDCLPRVHDGEPEWVEMYDLGPDKVNIRRSLVVNEIMYALSSPHPATTGPEDLRKQRLFTAASRRF